MPRRTRSGRAGWAAIASTDRLGSLTRRQVLPSSSETWAPPTVPAISRPDTRTGKLGVRRSLKPSLNRVHLPPRSLVWYTQPQVEAQSSPCRHGTGWMVNSSLSSTMPVKMPRHVTPPSSLR